MSNAMIRVGGYLRVHAQMQKSQTASSPQQSWQEPGLAETNFRLSFMKPEKKMAKFYMIEQNQTDARYQIKDGDVCQTLTARCGTGGGHVPMVIFDVSGTQDKDTGQTDALQKLSDTARTESAAETSLFYNDRRRADYHQADEYAPAVTAKYGTGGATRR